MSNGHPEILYKFRKFTRIAALSILTLFVVGLFLPTTYQVERSVIIRAPLNDVSNLMFQGDLLSKWMFIQNGKVASFDGSLAEGDSVDLLYNGSDEKGILTLVKLTNRLVLFDVKPKSKKNVIHNQIILKQINQSTELKWLIKGDLNSGLLSSYLAIFANDIAGRNFEISLQRLKELAELKSSN